MPDSAPTTASTSRTSTSPSRTLASLTCQALMTPLAVDMRTTCPAL
jgi:hypothetical protein